MTKLLFLVIVIIQYQGYNINKIFVLLLKLTRNCKWYDLEADRFSWFFQASWSYSKYIEALEQERVLLKMQEDLEKASLSVLTGC